MEKRFRDGKPAGYGSILAAQFVNQGETYRAIRFEDGDRPAAYYDLEGKSLRKAFLRAPLAFSRISSGFSWHRFHPITKTWKAHPAIDYAAPVGTPIKAVGDGAIIKKGYTKYNGNFIKIRHNSTYETLYLHMSRFAKSMRRGNRVSQGQVIGYVGPTGLATGPHLCFRMYRNGTPVNPNKVRSAAAAPISKKHLSEFESSIRPLIDRPPGRRYAAGQNGKSAGAGFVRRPLGTRDGRNLKLTCIFSWDRNRSVYQPGPGKSREERQQSPPEREPAGAI